MNEPEKTVRSRKPASLELVVAGLLAALIMVLAIPLITRSSGEASPPSQHHTVR